MSTEEQAIPLTVRKHDATSSPEAPRVPRDVRHDGAWFNLACRLRRLGRALGLVGVGKDVNVVEVAACLSQAIRQAGGGTVLLPLDDIEEHAQPQLDAIVLVAHVGKVTEAELLAHRWRHKIAGVVLLDAPLKAGEP